MSRDEPKPDSRRAEVEGSNATPADKSYGERIAELCRQHEKALLRMLFGRVSSMQEARDIAQEAYVRLLALDRPGTVSFLEGYLWKIAANIATDGARARKYRSAHDLTLASEPDSTSPSPEFVCLARERLAICQKAIEVLPPKCRMAFILRVIDELPFEEIAQRMSIDISGVKRYVARAAVHCQQAVDAAEQIEGSLI